MMLVLVLLWLCLRNKEAGSEKPRSQNIELETANTKGETAEIKSDCHQPTFPQRHISYILCAEMLIVLLDLIPLHADESFIYFTYCTKENPCSPLSILLNKVIQFDWRFS